MSLGLAPLFMGTFPVFLPPISKELGWGAAVYPQSALMAGTASAVAGPLVGAALDRFGVRAVLLTGLIGWAAALVVFPGATHELARGGAPRMRIGRLDAIVDWFQRYLET